MNKSRLLCALCSCLFTLATTTSHAALFSRLAGQAYYDDVLDITWLADADLAASNTFGLASEVSLGAHPDDSSNLVGVIGDRRFGGPGFMNWPGTLFWLDAMNAINYLGFSDWRLPTLSPIDGSAFNNSTFGTNGSTDLGYAPTTTDGTDGGWRDGSGNPLSELGHMFYVNLGNLGFCMPNDLNPGDCIAQTDWGLINTGPFSNVQSGRYWTGIDFSTGSTWAFETSGGYQRSYFKHLSNSAWAVRSGDVGAVSEPPLVLMLVTGLLGLAEMARRRKAAGRNHSPPSRP